MTRNSFGSLPIVLGLSIVLGLLAPGGPLSAQETMNGFVPIDKFIFLVDGDEGYRIAKQVMRTLMPSHAKRVMLYSDRIPLFHRFQVESQFDAMHSLTRLARPRLSATSPTF